jgi:hypothetical protein
MEVSGQLHVPTVLPPGEEFPVPVGWNVSIVPVEEIRHIYSV